MRVSIVGIYVKELESAPAVNEILHEYSAYVEGRFGLPKVKKDLHIITIVFHAPKSEIDLMIEKLNSIKGIQAMAYYEDMGCNCNS